MVFVPCENGISHNEIENATMDDCAAGANVLLHAMLTPRQCLKSGEREPWPWPTPSARDPAETASADPAPGRPGATPAAGKPVVEARGLSLVFEGRRTSR